MGNSKNDDTCYWAFNADGHLQCNNLSKLQIQCSTHISIWSWSNVRLEPIPRTNCTTATTPQKNVNKNEAPHSVLRLQCVIEWQNIYPPPSCSACLTATSEKKGSTPLHDLNLIHFKFAHPHSYTYALGDAGTRKICCRGRMANSYGVWIHMPKKSHALWGLNSPIL